jgi:hypothetical protein
MAGLWDALGLGTPIWVSDLKLQLKEIDRKADRIMTELQDTLDKITNQLGKAKDEIVNQIANLETQIAAGETPDLTALTEAAQALDDVVPDQPAEETPTEEPPQ